MARQTAAQKAAEEKKDTEAQTQGEVLDEGRLPDDLEVKADAAAAAAEVNPKEQEKEDLAGFAPYNEPVEGVEEGEKTAAQEALAKFNYAVQTNPASLAGQIAQVDTSGTVGRTDSASIVASNVAFHHPARLAQNAAAIEAASGESAEKRLADAIKEITEQN